MTVSDILLVTAVLCALWGIVSSIVIFSWLSSRGVSINFFMIRLLIFRYISTYRCMTIAEDGRPGFWFYSYIWAMVAALVAVVLSFILR